MMQDNCPLRLRNPTPRSRLERSAHRPRIVPSASAPGLIVTTMNIAARVSLEATDCDTGGGRLETMFDPIGILVQCTTGSMNDTGQHHCNCATRPDTSPNLHSQRLGNLHTLSG